MDQPTPEQREAFRAAATDMGRQIVQAIEGPQSPWIVMEALFLVHRMTVLQLSPEQIGMAAMATASYAGELMKASANGGAPQNQPIH
ncbi:hypothetical protein [Acidovorax sp. BLS4]|uniref:hypothetical protein n=1 Tax=Acidovorax sp. BLS4 TaxID=3273430 RepID=UPI002943B441|nr:hypothetical protein [Paracidovorax avenae]WOI47712.1 hypothetical protein R1Z03_11065 [Paracidovorax avenae]